MLDQGYGILPNKVLFDKDISSTAKLLYVYVSSLCAAEGKCWATNDHIALKMGISKSQVSRQLKSLDTYVNFTYSPNGFRIITLAQGYTQKAQDPSAKMRTPLRKNRKHNITKQNSTNLIKEGLSPTEYMDRYYNQKPTVLPDWLSK